MKTSLLTLCLLLLFAVSETLAGVLRVGAWSSSGSTPHSTLTSALAAATSGDEVWVVSNTYREAELIIPAGVSVYGGFTGSETALSERDYATNVTILDGSGAHRVATVSGLLDGFTLRNGRTGDNGGGVIVKSGGTLSHCIAFANEAGYDGGGVFAEDNATVTNTLLTGNRAGNDGAALNGTRGFKAMNITAAGNTLTGMPVIDALTGVPASLQAGGVLDVAPPAISSDGGSTVLMKGWELDGNAISMPYTVTYADNGKKLRYWAANAVGVGVSTEVPLTVTWTVTSSAQLLTPKAVCEGTTLADAGISNPVFSPAPDGGASYIYYIDGATISGLDYVLQYSDNGKLLTCEIKNNDGSISGATTPAVRLAVMKAPKVLLASVASLSIEEEQPLCLPTPVVISNGSDIKEQGWKWRIGAGAENSFNSCDKATMAMNGAEIYYTAENGCGTAPAAIYTSTLTVTAPVGEFLQTVSALCSGMTLDDCISFADGGNPGDYYIGDTYIGKAGEEGNFTTSWDDVKATVLTVAHNLQPLRFSYNEGKSERRMTLTVHAVPEITTDPATPPDALCLGDAHTLTIEATGDNLSYQWERSVNSTDGIDGDWDNVPGSTSAACRLTADVSAYYRCTVTGVCIDHSTGADNKKITSDFAQVTVHDRPVIPEVTALNPLTLCEGETVTALLAPLKPVLSGTPATAEGWTLGGINIADDYSVEVTDNGKLFGYHASNACGERTATFSTLKLTVDSKPKVTQDPLDVSAVEDTPVRLSVVASGSNLTYRWQQKAHADADTEANWHDIAGETNPAYSFTAANITTDIDLDGADVLTDYRCVVGTTNACATTTVKSATATVTVTRNKSAVSIRRQPAAYEVCNSDAAPYAPGFTVEVEGSGRFVYKWYGTGDKTTPVEQTPASGDLADAVADKTNTFKPSAAGTYFCVITSTDDNTGAQTQAATLTVSQAPVIHSITPASATICEGGSVTLGVDATGSALTYQWYQQAGATRDPDTDTKKGTAPTYTPVGLAATAKFYCVVGSGSVCTATEISNTVEVTIEKAPKITTQPLSQSVCGAAGIDLIVVADNTDSWQWYYNGKAIPEADGGKKATLADVKNGGVYTCVVSKTGGVCGEATSVPALITVANSPEVKLGTATGLMACKGDLVTLASPVVEANGSVVVPEKTGWYLSTAADPATAPVVASCVVDNTVTYNYKITYKCSATSPETTITAAMPAFTVTVNTPVAITSQPKDQNECDYQQLSVAATGTATISYKWYYNGGAATTADIDNVAAQSATPKKDGVYTCEVSNACGSVTSAPAVVKKKAATVIATQPVAATICKGESVSLGVKATGDDVTYQWYSGTTNNPTTVISGATSSTLSVSPTADTYYKCMVSGCTDKTSNVVKVTVRAATAITALSGQPSGKVCNTATMPTLAVAATGEGTLTYQWYKDGAAISGATGVNYTVKSSDLGSHNYEVKVTGGCGSMLSQSADVEIVKIPVVTLPTAGITACKGDVVTLPVPAVEANGSVVDPATTGWCSSANETLVNSWKVLGTTATTWRYKVGYTCGANTGQKVFSLNLTVTPNEAPTITVQPKDEVKCASDAFTNLSVTVTGTAPKYQWYKDNAAQSGGTNSSYAPGQNAGVYHCVASNECGTATSAPATLVRNAAIAATAYADKTALCGSEATIVGVKVTAGAPASYQWDKGDAAITNATLPNMAVVGEDGTAAVSRTYNCTVTDVCGKTVKPSVVVTHNPVPKITAQPVGGEVCNAAKDLSVTATGARSYQWYKNGGSIGGATSASYSVPNAVGSHSYYCMVTSDQCGSVVSASVQVSIEQSPSFVSSAALSTPYAGVGGDQIMLPAVPDYTANGSTITGGRWVYGSSSAVLGSTWQSSYNNQALYYQISYKGVCNSGGTVLRSPQQGIMQWADFFSNDVPSGLIAGKFYTMMDTRDRKVYRIKKMADNRIWMVQNLDYGTCTAAYNDANSKGNVQGITGAGGERLYGVCKNSADNGSRDNGKTFKYYNWQGVMQRADAYYGNSIVGMAFNDGQGICPGGWHLPSSDELNGLKNALGSSSANLTSTADNNASAWAGVLGGNVYYDGSFSSVGGNGYYWSSTQDGSNDAYRMNFYSGKVFVSSYEKYYGKAVRCLKN